MFKVYSGYVRSMLRICSQNFHSMLEEMAELKKDANKLREEKAELTTTKVELQLALRQVRSPNVYNFCDDRFPVGPLLPIAQSQWT